MPVERKTAARAAASPSEVSPGGVPSERPVQGYTIEVHRTEFDEQDEDDGVWWLSG